MSEIIAHIGSIYARWAGEEAKSFDAFPPSGSNRQYFRVSGEKRTAVAVFHPDEFEYRAFVYFTMHFMKAGLPVPELLAEDRDHYLYLLSDLGSDTLFDRVIQARTDNEPAGVMDLYRRVLLDLIRFQLEGRERLDLSQAYPVARFNGQAMLWDLNYFKYFFLKLSGIPFHEARLEHDFRALVSFLEGAGSAYFMYRDFQSRNIHILENKLYYIDYQGGRMGPLAYDPASLLYQARAGFLPEEREALLSYYITQVGKHVNLDEACFRQEFTGFVLLRILQVLGAYGYRGWFEGKPHFIRSILPAFDNLRELVSNHPLPVPMPYLREQLLALSDTSFIREIRQLEPVGKGLMVVITSFSYKSGIPVDYSGNGGGFVFDCRFLDNPGRMEDFRYLTGLDRDVIHYLEEKGEVQNYLQQALYMVSEAVEKYLHRDFRHLMVSFGCTGGQHRSVYMAERLAEKIRSAYPVEVKVWHRELMRREN